YRFERFAFSYFVRWQVCRIRPLKPPYHTSSQSVINYLRNFTDLNALRSLTSCDGKSADYRKEPSSVR
ncbi:MAG: hypothetical protein ACI4RJ_01805, partial [Alphaproteobacteria bacterium]